MGKIYVIGIGPGGAQETTPRAQAALAASDVLEIGRASCMERVVRLV